MKIKFSVIRGQGLEDRTFIFEPGNSSKEPKMFPSPKTIEEMAKVLANGFIMPVRVESDSYGFDVWEMGFTVSPDYERMNES